MIQKVLISAQDERGPSEHGLDREAFNAAFRDLGLNWHWDVETHAALLRIPGEKVRLRTYLEGHHAHLLKAYDADFLIAAILEAKSACRDSLLAAGPSAHRPGIGFDMPCMDIGF